jgi:FkbM family methyltransferase
MEEFRHEYDVDETVLIAPRKRRFKMLVTPRYLDHYCNNTYEEFTADLLSNLIKDGTLFIDIGAHYGFYSLLVGSQFKNSKIIAFEPVPESFSILQKNIRMNGLKNIEPYNLAVSAQDETRSFNITAASDSAGFYQHPLTTTIRTTEVKAIALDNCLGARRDTPTVVKIDTEGHELSVLEGMSKILKERHDIKLFIEFNPACLKSAGFDPGDLLRRIDELEFDMYFINDEAKKIYKLAGGNFQNWDVYLGNKNYINMFCTKKQKSLSVCFFSHSSQLAGAERSLLELTSELVRDHGVICTVLLPNDGPLKQKLEELGVSTLVANYAWWCGSHGSTDDEMRAGLRKSFKVVLEQLEELKIINPDVVVTNTLVIPWGAITASLLGKPHIWSVHEFGKLDHDLKFYLSFQRTLKIIKDASNVVLTNSNAVKKTLFGESGDNNISTIYYNIDIPADAVQEYVTSYFRKPHATKLIISGNITENKGQEDGVLAIKELVRRGKDVELVIMGTASPRYLRELEEIVRDQNLSGYVGLYAFRENPYPVINQADIVLVCSKQEAFGRVTVEAMLLKKPVIGTNSGGTSELIREGYNGLLYEPGNYTQLADKIEYLIEHRETSNEIGKNGFEFAKATFTPEKYGGQIHKLLADLKTEENLSSPYLSFLTEWLVDLQTVAHVHQEALVQREANIAQLQEALVQREANTAQLQEALAQRERQITHLIAEREDLTQNIAQLHSSIQSREQEIARLAAKLEGTTVQFGATQKELSEIKTSLAWHLIKKYRHAKDILLRSGTNRRRLYEQVLEQLKNISLKDTMPSRSRGDDYPVSWVNQQKRRIALLGSATILFVRQYGFRVLFGKVIATLRIGGLSGFKNAVRAFVTSRHPAVRQKARADHLFGDQQALQIREIQQPAQSLLHKCAVDIIICVHNARADVENCLESVIRNTSSPFSVIIVDDGSSEETRNYLDSFISENNAKLIRNNQARGYTFAANQGLRESSADYVILLNSDTQVAQGWLDRMVECAESDAQIGIVGPLSNTASWQSIPDFEHKGDWARNPLPAGLTVDEMASHVIEYSARLYPRIPFLNGFCLLIRRSLIHAIGYLDEELFGRGYGEENDFCLRARKAGWQLAVADDVYIYHRQSASYSDEMRKRLYKHADSALVAKHGQEIISEGVAICWHDRVLQGLRGRSRAMLKRTSLIQQGRKQFHGRGVLFVLPSRGPNGGSNVIIQESEAMLKMGVDVKILNMTANRSLFERGYPGVKVPVLYVEQTEDIGRIGSQFDAVVATAHYSVPWLDSLKRCTRLPVRGYYIQDFEPYFHTARSKDFDSAMSSYTLFENLVRFTKTEWNRLEVQQMVGVDCHVIGPSINLDLYRPRRCDYAEWPQRPLRVTAMIRPDSPRRGPKLTMEILREIYRKYGDEIQIILFGCYPEDPAFLALPHDFAYRNLGVLTPSQVAYLMNEVDIFADFSSYQAMGLTAMEAMACGAAVIIPSKGGCKSFSKDGENSLVVNTESREACFMALDDLVRDADLRWRLQRNAVLDMCNFYPEACAYRILEILFGQKTEMSLSQETSH